MSHLSRPTTVQGTSDKFYRVYSINESELTCLYGRNGTYGVFTPRKGAPNAAAAAKSADKAVAGKSAKGYQIVRSGLLSFDHIPTDSDLDSAVGRMAAGASQDVSTPAAARASAVSVAANTAEVDPAVLPRVTKRLSNALDGGSARGPATNTAVPMLAQVATKAKVQHMLASPSWALQPKLDGDRLLIVVEHSQVSAENRSGQPKVKNVGDAHQSPFRSLTIGRWAFDGEIVGRTFHVFDMPAGGRSSTSPRRLKRPTTLRGVDRVVKTGEICSRRHHSHYDQPAGRLDAATTTGNGANGAPEWVTWLSSATAGEMRKLREPANGLQTVVMDRWPRALLQAMHPSRGGTRGGPLMRSTSAWRVVIAIVALVPQS